MDRQLRNIALVTLLIVSLTIVAVVTPQPHRSPTNTAILIVALIAASGSVLSLLANAVWLRVIRQDVRKWWEARRVDRKWKPYHYLAREPMITVPDDSAIRARGIPCIVMTLAPPGRMRPERRALEGASVSCVVERLKPRAWQRPATRALPPGREECPAEVDVFSCGMARWPDAWFNELRGTPKPGRYRIRWEVRLPNGDVKRVIERVHIAAEGKVQIGAVRRAADAQRRLRRHLRGLDQ